MLTTTLIAAGALIFFVGWALRSRPVITGTPVPPPYQRITAVHVGPGDRLCNASVALDPATRQAVFLVAPGRRKGPALHISVVAPGYRATARAPGGYTGPAAIPFALPAPDRSDFATVCLRTEGSAIVALQGTLEDRLPSRTRTTLNGHPIGPRVALVLNEGRARSLISRPGRLADHISAFAPGFVNHATLALLGLLVILGIPAGVVLAVREALRPPPLPSDEPR